MQWSSSMKKRKEDGVEREREDGGGEKMGREREEKRTGDGDEEE